MRFRLLTASEVVLTTPEGFSKQLGVWTWCTIQYPPVCHRAKAATVVNVEAHTVAGLAQAKFVLQVSNGGHRPRVRPIYTQLCFIGSVCAFFSPLQNHGLVMIPIYFLRLKARNFRAPYVYISAISSCLRVGSCVVQGEAPAPVSEHSSTGGR